MKQYCRYCKNATLIDEKSFICKSTGFRGNYGSGRVHKIDTARRGNRCKWFKFKKEDMLNPGHTYKPHGAMYCKVTRDEYECIEAIADTSQELAEMCGVKRTTVLKGVERYEKGQYNTQWRRIML